MKKLSELKLRLRRLADTLPQAVIYRNVGEYTRPYAEPATSLTEAADAITELQQEIKSLNKQLKLVRDLG